MNNAYISFDVFDMAIEKHAKVAKVANSELNQIVINAKAVLKFAKKDKTLLDNTGTNTTLAGVSKRLADTSACNHNILAILAGLATFPKQTTETVHVNHAPEIKCISGECEYCCSPTLNFEAFVYCKKIAYPVEDLFNDYGACPEGKWMKSTEHYNNLVTAINQNN